MSAQCQGCTDLTQVMKRPLPELSDEERVSKAAPLLKAMGIQACDSTSGGASFGAQVKAGIVAAGTQMSTAFSRSIGCESLAMIVDQYNEALQRTTNLLDCACYSVQTNAISRQNVRITLSNSTIKCNNLQGSGIVIKQNSTVKLINDQALSDDIKTGISNVAKTLATSVVNVAQDVATDVGAPDSAQRSLLDIQKTIETDEWSNDLRTNINEVLAGIQNEQDVRINILNSNIEGCIVIEQDALLELAAKSIVDNVVDKVLSNVREVESLTEAVVEQTKKAAGLAEVTKQNWAGPEVMGGMVGAIIAVIAILVVVFLLMRMLGGNIKKSEDNKDNKDDPQTVAKKVARKKLMSTMVAVFGIVGALSLGTFIVTLVLWIRLRKNARTKDLEDGKLDGKIGDTIQKSSTSIKGFLIAWIACLSLFVVCLIFMLICVYLILKK